MNGPGMARERKQEVARPAVEAGRLADALPAVSLIGGVLLAIAIGAPTGP